MSPTSTSLTQAPWTRWTRLSPFAAVLLLSTRGLERHGRELLAGYAQRGGGMLVAAGPDVEPRVHPGSNPGPERQPNPGPVPDAGPDPDPEPDVHPDPERHPNPGPVPDSHPHPEPQRLSHQLWRGLNRAADPR